MALRQMPNGAFVNIPDDITPEGYARVAAQYKATPRQKIAARVAARKSSTEDEDEKHVKEIAARTRRGRVPAVGAFDAATDNAAHMFTLGLDDVVGPAMLAGTEGVVRAVQKRDAGQIGRTYKNAREAGRLVRDEVSKEHPIASGVGSVMGLLANPIGAELGIARGLAAGARGLKTAVPAAAPLVSQAERAAQALKASGIGRRVAKVGGSNIGTAARAGFNQGAVMGLARTGDAGEALTEGGIGGVAGGILGGAIRGGQALHGVVRNQSVAKAKDIAIERIAKMLGRSEDVMTGRPYTPGQAVREIRATDAAGGDATLADLTREGQSWASYLAKQPGNRASAHVINKADQRAEMAGERFEDRVRRALGIAPDASTAHSAKAGLKAERKVRAAEDYTPEVMNKQMAWSDELEDLFKGNEIIRDAMPHAEKLTRMGKGQQTQNVLHPQFGIDPQAPTFAQAPSMQVMDNVIKGLDDLTGKAVKAGEGNLARMYSSEARALKTAVGKVNPKYAEARGHQRDLFEQTESIELGQKLLKGLASRDGSHQLMDDIASGRIKPDELKIGFADALMGLREKGNPVALMRKLMRTPSQREVLTHMFGSNKNLVDFERFMRRELRGAHTDAMVTSGRQMPSNVTREPPSDAEGAAFGEMARAAGQGMAFGGPIGAGSRLLTSAVKWKDMLGPAAKEELSRILASKGEGLEAALVQFQKKHARDIIRARRAYTAVGKVPQASVGGYVEQ